MGMGVIKVVEKAGTKWYINVDYENGMHITIIFIMISSLNKI